MKHWGSGDHGDPFIYKMSVSKSSVETAELQFFMGRKFGDQTAKHISQGEGLGTNDQKSRQILYDNQDSGVFELN